MTHTLAPSCGPYGTRCDMRHDAPLPSPCPDCGELPTWCVHVAKPSMIEKCAMPADPFPDLSASQMDVLVSRAYREAASCWSELRSCRDDSIRQMLFDAAESAEQTWREYQRVSRLKWAAVSGVEA